MEEAHLEGASGQGGGGTHCIGCQQGVRRWSSLLSVPRRHLTQDTGQLWPHPGAGQECRLLPRPRPAEWESAFERDRGGFLCTSKSEKGHPALLPFFTPPASMKTPSVKRQGQHRQLLGRERPPGPWSLTHSCWVSSSPSAAGLRPPSRLEPRAGPHPASIARFPFAPGRQG